MFRILIILGLVCSGSAFAADSDEKNDNVQRYRAYFESLDLPYAEPRGCGNEVPCSVVGDFNDDGVEDMAALYEYSGGKARRAGWNLDLVVLFSQKDSSEPTHSIFSHIGQIDARSGKVSASLAVQEKGLMETPGGGFPLERSGINVFYGPNRGPGQYLTFYWRGESFHSIDKSDD
jgi:hypothetical protein